MKIRIGFVSNSSSASFLILGVESNYIIDEIIKAWKWEKTDSRWSHSYKIFEDEGYAGIVDWQGFTVIGDGERIDYIGIDPIEGIKANIAYDDLVKAFINEVFDSSGVIIDKSDVDIIYGESSN